MATNRAAGDRGEHTVRAPGARAAGNDRRWRAFADLVALALGVNVWISVVILPAAFVGGLHGTTGLALRALPALVLLLGVARRSEAVLLALFPAATLVPIAIAPQMASAQVYGPIRFAVVALGLVAYLLGVSFFTTFHEPPAPVSSRPLSSSATPPPPRWRRRERVYWGLLGLSILLPASLLWFANFDGDVQLFLGKSYPGRVALMTTVIDVGVVALWLALYLRVFLGVMQAHRTGDRELVTRLALTHAQGRSGRPRARFYLGVAGALVFMALLVVLRHL
jgi:hypothetical protein